MRGRREGRLCLTLRRTGSRYWRRWRKELSFWLITAGYVSAAAASTRSRSMLGCLWRGACIWAPQQLVRCFISSITTLTFPSFSTILWTVLLLCRYESLDDLDALRLSTLSTATFSCPRPHSAAAGYRAPTRNASSRYSTGTMLSHRNEFDGYALHLEPCSRYFLCYSFSCLTLLCAGPGWCVRPGYRGSHGHRDTYSLLPPHLFPQERSWPG